MRLISVIDVISAAASKLTSPRYRSQFFAGERQRTNGGRMPKVKGESALNKERAKTEKLLKKVG